MTHRRCSSSSRHRPNDVRYPGEERLQTSDQINAVIAKVSPYVPLNEVATALSRWKHLNTLTQDSRNTC